RPVARRALAGRGGGPRAPGAHAPPRRAPRHPHRRVGRAGAPGGSGSLALEPRPDRRGRHPRRAGPARSPTREVRGAGGHRRPARAGEVGARDRLAADRGALRTARGDPPLPGRRAQPGGRGRDGRRAGARAGHAGHDRSAGLSPVAGGAGRPLAPIGPLRRCRPGLSPGARSRDQRRRAALSREAAGRGDRDPEPRVTPRDAPAHDPTWGGVAGHGSLTSSVSSPSTGIPPARPVAGRSHTTGGAGPRTLRTKARAPPTRAVAERPPSLAVPMTSGVASTKQVKARHRPRRRSSPIVARADATALAAPTRTAARP